MKNGKRVFISAILTVVVVATIAGAAYAQTLSQQAPTSPRSTYEQFWGQRSGDFVIGTRHPLLSGNPLGVCRQNRYSTQPAVDAGGMMR